MSVGIKELRNGLSRYLATVRSGHTLTVTEHGRPVARIVPVGVPTSLERLVAEGRVIRSGRPKLPSRPPVRAAGTVSDLVGDQRR